MVTSTTLTGRQNPIHRGSEALQDQRLMGSVFVHYPQSVYIRTNVRMYTVAVCMYVCAHTGVGALCWGRCSHLNSVEC